MQDLTPSVQTGGRTYLYAPDQRLASVKQGSSDIARYSYDAQGRRRSKTVGTATTHYDYDLQGRLLGEDRVPGDYVYLDGEPLARVDYNLSDWSGNVASWNIAYYHNNPVGAPLQTTDRLGQISWSAQLDPFGKATPINPTITQNLRFPGQYYDQETGLHYNMARYYDPSNGGRYLQSDPIGLGGGINTYTYVSNNPLRWIDPFGLDSSDPEPGLQGVYPEMALPVFRVLRLPAMLAKQNQPTEQCPNYSIKENFAKKIFGDREGHLPDTPANRQLLENVANDQATTLGPDKFGNQWSAKTLEDGT